MIRSMTAFARQQEHGEYGELTWEIRSVNHRFLETTVRLPEDLRGIEPVVRERVTARLGRGKVECNLRFKTLGAGAAELRVNDALVEQIMTAADRMAHRLHSSHNPSIMDILRWPGVLESAEMDFTPVQEAAVALLGQAIDTLVETREREGDRLAQLIVQRVDAMRAQVEIARERMPFVIEGVRARLKARLDEVAGNLDQERLEQEMALLAQRLDVDEEMDRLRTHLDEVSRVLEQDEPVGRRLDFLMRELNREANTLGSKSADSETTAISVEMKVLIEQMREQVQNIE
ncbi:MAG: YicC/YloC family endoribonuclease [Sedimenticolaceae bacterium]